MKISTILIASLCIGVNLAQHAQFGDLDMNDDFSEDEFLTYFGLPAVKDPKEKARRAQALKKAEADVHKVNEEYQAGKKSWHEEINENSDLPDDEFAKDHEGLLDISKLRTGLLPPREEDKYHEESERYFESVRLDRTAIPSSYSSVEQGFVSPVRNQKSCGSCVAFASMAAIETCFKKVTGRFGDYSEQQLLDCGYGKNWAGGCRGAAIHSYLKWAGDSKLELAHESTYPYKAVRKSCPRYLKPYKQGAKITGSYYTFSGDEELLKKLVYKHGAVVAALATPNSFKSYKGGVYAGCSSDASPGHAITVVGYGSENGMDYWLIKNSWGSGWGNKGFIKIQRGVKMCKIGVDLSVTICQKATGATSRPLTTEKPCFNKYSNCDTVKDHCWRQNVKTYCPRTCGLCKGMTPVTITCYDYYVNCARWAAYCHRNNRLKNGCKKTCGVC